VLQSYTKEIAKQELGQTLLTQVIISSSKKLVLSESESELFSLVKADANTDLYKTKFVSE
jgi:hypothetical protein